MAFISGGIANKQGNQYEKNWTVKQLLRLLNEEIRSVTVEPFVGNDHGVDLVIVQNDDRRQFQQCKARIGSKQIWSVADLNAQGILKSMQIQLERNPYSEFALVAGDSGTLIHDLCDDARRAGDDLVIFNEQIDKKGQESRFAYEAFYRYLTLRKDSEQDQRQVFHYLQRLHIIHWPDDLNAHDEMCRIAKILVIGTPQVVIDTLGEYAIINMRKPLFAPDVRNFLTQSEMPPRLLAHDDRIAPEIERLRRKFEESIMPGLIAEELIPRQETQELLKALDEANVVVLHGAAGCGKSGVLYELTQVLLSQNRMYLPIRLDRQIPKNTSRQFGIDLGLPESPVHCLASLGGTQRCVLILDQLDALRWTSAHSANALDVCKDMVREAQYLSCGGQPISIILSCRTFDLEHDPEIKNWLAKSNESGTQYQKIEVKRLPDTDVEGVVRKFSVDYAAISAKQKDILSLPQHLSMWVNIIKNGQTPAFKTATQLMQEFWTAQRRQMEIHDINAATVDTILATIIDYMERTGKISAPASLIAIDQKISCELHTLGIIRTDDTTKHITFCHQSYLDFRIADRVLRDIHTDQGDVVTWLGSREKQTLFRREQLRQVLWLLADESPCDFLSSVRSLLQNDDVRFHLKHLALTVISQIETPNESLCDYLLDLFEDDYWQQHVFETIFWGQPQFTEFLIKKGCIGRWLDSDRVDEQKMALRLLRTVAEKIPDSVTEILEPFLTNGGDWPSLILGALCWDIENDSDRMFALRLSLAKMGTMQHSIHWRTLTKNKPDRAIDIIKVVLSTWTASKTDPEGKDHRNRQSRLEQWYKDDLTALREMARRYPKETWDAFIGYVDQLTVIKKGDSEYHINDWRENYIHSEDESTIKRGVVLLLQEAGRVLATTQPSDFLERAEAINDSLSPVTMEILAISYAELPANFADKGIEWLLADHKRFSVGSGYNKPEWNPAAALIKTLSPHCSLGLFRNLEQAIVSYHEPDEKAMAECNVSLWKRGFFADYWGRAQYFLLPALEEQRRSKETQGLIGVLKRKYAKYHPNDFMKGSVGKGGGVTSPLWPKSKLPMISDHAWLNIINNQEISKKREGKWNQLTDDVVAESSVRHFANDLRTLANRYPKRFAQLALRFPPDVHPDYIAAVLDGVKATQPKDIPDEEKADWEPADVITIEEILTKFLSGNQPDIAREVCWLISERAKENWSDQTLNTLLEYVKHHPDPQANTLNTWKTSEGNNSNTCSSDMLVGNAINCVRGVGGRAIGQLLWEHPDWMEKLRSGIERLVQDHHPAVRVAALEACLPVINIDKSQAVQWFLMACMDDLRVTCSHIATRFFNCCIHDYEVDLAPLVRKMIESDNDEVAEHGAQEVCARWLFHDMFSSEFMSLNQSSRTAHRKGIAEIASTFLRRPEFFARCRELLIPLFRDDDLEVRKIAQRVFYNKPELLKLPGIIDIVRDFIKTQAFLDGPTGLVFTLEHFEGPIDSIEDIVFAVCEEFAGPLAEISHDFSQGIAHDATRICPLLLRLYEQTLESKPEIAKKCLDNWDILFEARVGIVRELTKHIDDQ